MIKSYSQDSKTYFEQQGNKISVEAENAMGYGWINISLNGASSGTSILFPETDTLHFQVIEDSYVDLYNKNTNYGSNMKLIVDGKGGNKRGFFTTLWWNGRYEAFEKASFIKFDVSGLSDIIIEAKVFLYCLDSGTGGGIYELDPLMDDLNWLEMQATWNNRPSKDHDGNTFQDFVGRVNAGTWYPFDVTQALSGKGNGTYSFGIVMQENDYTEWSSKEGSHPPYLMLRVKSTGVSISGNVLYYSNNNPVANVKMNLSGGANLFQSSSATGYYFFKNLLANESYTIRATKPADTDIGDFTITSYDAALTAQAAVGIRTPSDYESIAADVSRDGQIYIFDAALIAQYSVGLPKSPDSHVAEWAFVPDNIYIAPLNSNQTGQNFTGIILGNVHSGWSQPGSNQVQSVTFQKYDQLPDIFAKPADDIIIPLEIDEGHDVISAAIDFSYNADVLKFVSINRSELSRDIGMVYNNDSGRLRAGLYSIHPFDESGILLKLRFHVIGEANTISELSLDRYQLNDTVVMKAKSRLIVSDESDLPLEFNVSQNYPNPFVPGGGFSDSRKLTTVINYQLPGDEKVSIKIYNFLGQQVRTLVDVRKKPGRYKAIWDGRDNVGELVSAGLYFYRFEAGDHVEMRRMVLLR